MRSTFSSDASLGESLVRSDQISRGSLECSIVEALEPTDPIIDHTPAEPPDMLAWDKAALYAHYACIGVVNGLLTQALMPYCLYVAHGEPNTCATIATFVNLPWGFKIIYGVLSDGVPICGAHRKPYMVIGWGLTFGCALLFALLDTIDLQTASLLFLLMTIAYLMADCAADAALVGISTLEPVETRGTILSTAYFIRFLFMIFAAAIMAFLYNGPATCGSFTFGLSTQQLMWVVVVMVGLFMGSTLPAFREVAASGRKPTISQRMGQLVEILQQPVVWRLILGLTSATAISLITNQAQVNANREWFHIEPLQLGLSQCFQNLVLAVGVHAYKRYLLNASWRRTYACGILGMQGFNLLYLLTIYFPAFKNGWWYVFTQVDMEFAYAFTFVIGIIIVPEITEPGYEGIIYGTITTYQNQAQNIANALNNILLAIWPTNADNQALATCALNSSTAPSAPLTQACLSPPTQPPSPTEVTCPEVQTHMTYLTLLAVGLACMSLPFILLMPQQKDHVRLLKQQPRSQTAGVLMVCLLVALVLVGTTFAVLPIFPATKCLIIAGGTGC